MPFFFILFSCSDVADSSLLTAAGPSRNFTPVAYGRGLKALRAKNFAVLLKSDLVSLKFTLTFCSLPHAIDTYFSVIKNAS